MSVITKRLFILALAVLTIGAIGSAGWKYNPLTGQLDYYLGADDGTTVTIARIMAYSPSDNTAPPVAATAALKLFAYNKSTAHNGVITLPTVTTAGFGIVTVGALVEYTLFWIDNDGDVTLLNNTTGIVANSSTDDKINIGTAAAQEPLQIKNSINATYIINIIFYYN